ncbi:hypothetical protein SKAU_G00060210 [Synaphobranchus kaupii]|uniref:HAT C-terminal dimerisation domain-containing protein n=1 Tax=Synaphobranchus kaupii TaxID=118154 RepID=A0A9Q1G5K6_SYNKA|nr:hypothetical protein SKAU_G00060210 [Synaphobranchus kaupii]
MGQGEHCSSGSEYHSGRRAVRHNRQRRDDEEEHEKEEEVEVYTPPLKKHKTALEQLFAEEDSELQAPHQTTLSISERVDQEVQLYRGLPSISVSADPAQWWWQKRDTLPLLSDFAQKYLSVQASSTLSERVFSTAGDTISPERSRILPEKADMLIFLQKNC